MYRVKVCKKLDLHVACAFLGAHWHPQKTQQAPCLQSPLCAFSHTSRYSLLLSSLGDLSDNSCLSLGVVELVVSLPLLALGVLLDEDALSLSDLLADGGLLLSLCSLGGLSDLGVDLLVEGLEGSNLSLGQGGVPVVELFLEPVLVLLLEEVEVCLDVGTEDVVSVLLGVVSAASLALLNDGLAFLAGRLLLLLDVVAGESLGVVGHVDATVNCTLEGAEDSVTGGGSDETNIEEGAEGTSVLVDALVVDVEELAVSSLNTLIEVSHAEVGQKSSGDEEAGGVGGSVVGKTGLNTEASELLGVGLAEDSIALDGGVDDLDDDLGVGTADAQSVLLRFVLVLVLLDESSTCLVVGLSFSSSSVLNLISGEV